MPKGKWLVNTLTGNMICFNLQVHGSEWHSTKNRTILNFVLETDEIKGVLCYVKSYV